MSEAHYEGDFGLHATSTAIEHVLESVNRSSPINLEFVTRPFGKASITRIRSLETIYAKSRLFRFLVRKGVNPILLFVSLSAGIAGGLRRFYKQSTQLALTLLGVVYPAWKCWQLVKEQEGMGQEREYKSWLTYWMIYGTFQVLDNWSSDILSLFPNYNLYKLAILYWAQSPHSKGASVLCHQVIQKPRYPAPPLPQQRTAFPSSPESHHADELTLTIEQSKPSILDGYTPTLQEPITDKQEPYMLEAEAAW